MTLNLALQFVPTFVLAFFRMAGMMVSVPLFGSARVPRRLKVMFALVLTAAIVPTLKTVRLPESTWQLAANIGGEKVFVLAVGSAPGFSFVGGGWGGGGKGPEKWLGDGQGVGPRIF